MKKETNNGKTVFAGLSGGVDSSVAALRLIKQGYKVVGVFIKVWHPDWLKCNWEEERLDAMRVAAQLKIPFLTCDAEEAYKKEVAEYFINEYKAGRTPNPDIMCNQYVKFGAFLKFALANGADYIATGHYARVRNINEKYQLLKGLDTAKDQSYFLWTLNQEQLAKILFPVGDSEKETIRREAKKASLPTATKKDSQGICFLGHVNIPEFIGHYADLEQGQVLNELGEVIGEHQGALVYTFGQRHGFVVKTKEDMTKPHYVVSKDLNKNTLTVSETPPIIDTGQTLTLQQTNWIDDIPTDDSRAEAICRYRGALQSVVIKNLNKNSCRLTLESEVDKPDSGQSCVLYSGDECLGGGIIG